MKKILFALVLALSVSTLFAQYEMDLLNYSQKIYMSDARSTGVGNAFSAVGANLISTSINPAGLAFYRKSEFVISNAFYFAGTNSEYLGSNAKANKVNYNIPSFGIVGSNVNKVSGKPVKEGWVNFNFAATINRTANFHKRATYSGNNLESSYLDFFAERAQGIHPDNLGFYTGMAYDAYFIDNPDTLDPTKYYTAFDPSTSVRNVTQTINTRTSGSMYDINFAMAANYSNRVFIGATIGVPTINYNRTLEFIENNNNPNPYNYIGSSHKSVVNIDGVGINATLGLLIRPFQFLRFGGSIQTPTVYSMDEYWQETMDASLIMITDNQMQEHWGTFDYRMVSPFRATAGAAFILGKLGFVSVDYEYLDYTMAYFDSDFTSMMTSNNRIQEYYKSVNNLRVGAEFKYQIFALRAGYNIYESPYRNEVNPTENAGAATVTSFGLGIREKGYSFDIAYQLIEQESFYLPYSFNDPNRNVEGATEQAKKNNIILTLGVRF